MDSSKITVSVVIPVYNVEEFLRETINSVLDQSLKNIQIILVNDGSQDQSILICDEYSKIDHRITVVNQENSGVSVARNRGLELAVGEYVFFMDSDDTIDQYFLSTSYEVAKKEDCDIVILGEYFCERTIHAPALPTWAQFIKREFLLNHSEIRFPIGIQPCEDGLFSHQLLALTQKISLNPRAIYYYRKHEKQNHITIQKNYVKVIEQIPQWLNILKAFYIKNNLVNSHPKHLALFLEHEPFELRYLQYNLSESQKEALHGILRSFYFELVNPFITNEEKKSLSKLFKIFIYSKTIVQFNRKIKRAKFIKPFKAKLINFIPVKKIRRQTRQDFNKTYRNI
jgi:glycosyltransferase involved in cell wall biosynthesis